MNLLLSGLLAILVILLIKAIYEFFFIKHVFSSEDLLEDEPIGRADLFDPDKTRGDEPIFEIGEFTKMRQYIGNRYVYSKTVGDWINVDYLPPDIRAEVIDKISIDNSISDDGLSDYEPEVDGTTFDVNRSSLSVIIYNSDDEEAALKKNNPKDEGNDDDDK